MHDQRKMLFVKNPVELFEGGIQSDFLESLVSGLDNRVVAQHVALEHFGLQAAKSGHSFNFASGVDDGQLVVALVVHDVDRLLHGQVGQNAQGCREVQRGYFFIKPPKS